LYVWNQQFWPYMSWGLFSFLFLMDLWRFYIDAFLQESTVFFENFYMNSLEDSWQFSVLAIFGVRIVYWLHVINKLRFIQFFVEELKILISTSNFNACLNSLAKILNLKIVLCKLHIKVNGASLIKNIRRACSYLTGVWKLGFGKEYFLPELMSGSLCFNCLYNTFS
jgi:hypothetical protein